MTQTERLMPEDSKSILFQPESDAIIVTPTYVSFSGVKVPRGEITERDRVLDPVKESKGFIDDDFSLKLQQTIATSFSLSQPLLIEGGSALGKTRTVKRMASLLGWEVHAVSCSRETEVDDFIGRMVPNPKYGTQTGEPEFIFLIGEIAKALIFESGVKKLILLDEVNVIEGGVLTALHEIIDEYNKGGKIINKKTSEVISINPQAVQIVSCMNPPRGYAGRNPLDQAQMRRYNYVNLGEFLSRETVQHRTYDSWGLETETNNPTIIENRDTPLTIKELNEIPKLKELVDKYLTFHNTVRKYLIEMKIGRDQAQKFIYDDAELTRKVRDFILQFYNGNINETIQTALSFYYVAPLENAEDKKIVLELIKNVQIDIVKTDSRRRTIPAGGTSSPRTPDTSPTTTTDSPAGKDVSPTPVASSERDIEPPKILFPTNQGTLSEEWNLSESVRNFRSDYIAENIGGRHKVLQINNLLEPGSIYNIEEIIEDTSQFLDTKLPQDFKTNYGIDKIRQFFESSNYSYQPELITNLLIHINNISTENSSQNAAKLNIMAKILVRVNIETFKKMKIEKLKTVFLNLKNYPLISAKFLGSLPDEEVFLNNLLSNTKGLELSLFVLDITNKQKIYKVYTKLFYGDEDNKIKRAPELILKYLDKFKGIKDKRGGELNLVQVAIDCIGRCKNGTLGLQALYQLLNLGFKIDDISKFKEKFYDFDKLIKKLKS